MPEADNTLQLPWSPIYTISRSGRPEVTVHGIVYAWAEDRSLYANAGRSLLRLGDTRLPLWSRSLLKPWQLMALYPTLKQAYPQLTARHFAVMTASQQSDPEQQMLLLEILEAGGLSETDLRCPSCRPMKNGENSSKGVGSSVPSPMHHPCCGKHLAHLLYCKAKGLPLENYLEPGQEPYHLLETLLGYLLNRELGSPTVDGCGMPNYALSAVEMAQLYHALVMPVPNDILRQAPDELTDILSHWAEIADLFLAHPDIIGGEGRLDSRLIRGEFLIETGVPVIAKEGADGLLAVAIGKNARFPDGLAFLVKVASGYEPTQLERIAKALLAQFELREAEPSPERAILKTDFHFNLPGVTV